jgi:hypothetical protein
MRLRISALLKRDQNFVHQRRVRSASKCVLLRLAHFRRGDHLHRLGQLANVADRFDPAPYVLCVRHCRYQEIIAKSL